MFVKPAAAVPNGGYVSGQKDTSPFSPALLPAGLDAMSSRSACINMHRCGRVNVLNCREETVGLRDRIGSYRHPVPWSAASHGQASGTTAWQSSQLAHPNRPADSASWWL